MRERWPGIKHKLDGWHVGKGDYLKEQHFG